MTYLALPVALNYGGSNSTITVSRRPNLRTARVRRGVRIRITPRPFSRDCGTLRPRIDGALAALDAMLALHEQRKDDLRIVLKAIPQHPAAMIASAVDECRGEPCPYCCAAPWEGCRPDCSSYFDR